MHGINLQRVEHLDISAVSILRGYGFVQFMFEADAREAVRMENGGLLKGNKLGTCRYISRYLHFQIATEYHLIL